MQEFYLVANPQEYKVATGLILQGQCAHLNQRCNRDFIDKDKGSTSPTKKDTDDTDSTSSLSQNELLKQINIFDTDEKVEIPKAANSHMTSSMLDDELVNKFVNCMMWGGKKSLSQKIFKLAMEEIKKEQLKKQRQSSQPDSVETDPLQIFATAIENCKPVIGVVGMKRAGTVYQVGP
ncbi:hypothetical protein pdam_00016288 [Pocillopora damicornis]|uniref:Small ribosomal subunit protein uS7 domain-containing protein n=1 Tax=Pocillopora damicornis TaxID=46731 RepID=A0A3M6TAI0_POCDA|nr:hypothetical protein pdam_00016288 [Pocillopora damicornis]